MILGHPILRAYGPTIPGIIGKDDITGANSGFSFITANDFTSAGDGWIISMNIYFVSFLSGESFVMGVYDDNAGKPNNLLGVTEVQTLDRNYTNEWYGDVDLTSTVEITNGQKIWLARRATSSFLTRYLTVSNSMARNFSSGAGTTLTDPFVFQDYSSQRFSQYANVLYF